MALYHFSVSVVTRTKGQSACAAAAYISGTKIKNEYDGIVHDYRRKQNVKYSEVMLPKNAPESFKDGAVLWSNVEEAEPSSTAQLCRPLQLSLPIELMENKTPEEYDALYISMTKGFLQHTFVEDGMCVHFAYHNPPMMNSRKQPIDINGNVTDDPSEYVYNNPHIHALLTMRPISPNGKWAPKSQKLYVCEKDGVQRNLSASEFKRSEGWEKIWKYRTPEGKTVWHTKSYALQHPEEGLSLASHSPKSVKVKNPTVARWDSPQMLEQWRAAWADAVNLALEQEGLDVRVDHRSYERQGMEQIPMINESKAVIMEEKRRFEAYKQKIADGESATLTHTDVRSKNLLIKQHNEMLRIRSELASLETQMLRLIAPVDHRIIETTITIIRLLEHLRAEIILTRCQIAKAKAMQWDVDQKITEYTAYLNNMPQSDIPAMMEQKASLMQQLENAKGPFKVRMRQELASEINALERQISLAEENQQIMDEINGRIQSLERTSEDMEKTTYNKEETLSEMDQKYRSLSAEAHTLDEEKVMQERRKIRPEIEKEFFGVNVKSDIKAQVRKFDQEMGCVQTMRDGKSLAFHGQKMGF